MKRATLLVTTLLLVAVFSPSIMAANYLCGDVNGDQDVNLDDILFLINSIYVEQITLPYNPMADVNSNGVINLTDILTIIDYLYLSGSGLVCGINHEDYQSECLEGRDGDTDTMYVEVEGFNIHVYHQNAYYDCCLGYYTPNSINLNQITVYEFDTIPECDCYCYFDLKTAILNLMPGEYVVTLIGIEEDTVGIDTAIINTFPLNHEEFQSGCLPNKVNGDDTMYVTVVGSDIHIHHDSAYYNCGLMYTMAFSLDNFVLTAIEGDTGAPAYCICYFDLESVVYNLPDGEYTVVLIGLEGDTVGVDHAVIGGGGYSHDVFQSGCLEEKDNHDEIMYVIVDGNDIHIHHDNAYYNCGLDYVVDFNIEGFDITATEGNIGPPADCICWFNLESVVYDLPPGEYTVTLIGLSGQIVGIDTVVIE